MSEAAQSWNMTLAEVLDIDEECIKAKQRLDEAYNALAKERAGGARRFTRGIKGTHFNRKDNAFREWTKAMEQARANHKKAVDEAAKAGLFGRGLSSYPVLMARYASLITMDSSEGRRRVC